MAVTVEDERMGAVSVVTVSGRLDGGAAPTVDDALSALVTPGARLVLDLSGLSYVSSAGLRVLLKLAKQVKAAKGSLALAGIVPAVSEVFDISGFTSIFVIHPDRDAAVAALS